MTDIPTTGAAGPAPLPAASSAASAAASSATSSAATASRDCPVCGTANQADSTFCEACGADLVVAARASNGAQPPVDVSDGTVLASATPQTAPAGEESPLDVGWTGAVPSAAVVPVADDLTCHACGEGHIVDGYCDHCGTPPPNPRDHLVESPTAWVGGVCDIGRRHARNEDAMSLSAGEPAGSRAVLVVCDGVSMATDSHIASLAAATAARAVLDQPFPKGVGTPDAWAAGAGRALTSAVTRANEAVAASVVEDVPNPPSCTFAAAVVEDDVIVAGNVGDSRVYWLPDDTAEPARQLGRDDSFAQEQMAAGVPRLAAETGPHAHSITRWLGKDAPDDLTPHLTTLTATPGWLMVCSDGLWNYCSEAEALRTLLTDAAARLDDATPTTVAQALVDFANEQGGRDNITVALARLAGRGSSTTTTEATAAAAPVEGDPTDG
ncbi:protein phosphatase 2C domain-containing protein [Terracoccus sp. 273MFTsu3.1]|uniref:protein phosphatase 2C domain-containing protein n=1 Tax=Terracoccus sp. 273MFTsu3.1 TaxID=1172188 RepID=UPI0003752BA7|nr:protein phosphatase 2C domain-containing protein [Terracoccus sp. 273MFTsu3.1]